MIPTACCVRFLTVFALAAGSVRVQCDTEWTGGHRLVGTDGLVRAVVEWDPDGAGPTTPLWVVGGRFRFAGGIHVGNVAVFDPATDTWSALGGGVSGGVSVGVDGVFALSVLPTNELVVGGDFTVAFGRSRRSRGQATRSAECHLYFWTLASVLLKPNNVRRSCAHGEHGSTGGA